MRSKQKLSRSFYEQKTLKVARELLGKFLVRKICNIKKEGMIVETEAYVGPHDLASHASRGKTNRTAPMFGRAGHAYIYLVYGMYYCFNVVTESENYPAAVLIRAIQTENEPKLTSGPGKLCRYLKIDKNLNNIDLTDDLLYIEDRGKRVPKNKIVKDERIGVDYAGKYKDKLWRFYIKDNPYVSKSEVRNPKSLSADRQATGRRNK